MAQVKINFHETYTVGARSWEGRYYGFRAVIIRINSGLIRTYRLFIYDPNGKQIDNPPDIDGTLRDAATEARRLLRLHGADTAHWEEQAGPG